MKGIIAAVMMMAGIACAEDAARKPVMYKVQQGDTLSKIAKRFGMKPQEIVSLNPGTNFRLLQVGQPLKVLPAKSEK